MRKDNFETKYESSPCPVTTGPGKDEPDLTIGASLSKQFPQYETGERGSDE